MERGRIESLKRKLINPKSRVALNDVAEQISELAENCPQEIIDLFLGAIKAGSTPDAEILLAVVINTRNKELYLASKSQLLSGVDRSLKLLKAGIPDQDIENYVIGMLENYYLDDAIWRKEIVKTLKDFGTKNSLGALQAIEYDFDPKYKIANTLAEVEKNSNHIQTEITAENLVKKFERTIDINFGKLLRESIDVITKQDRKLNYWIQNNLDDKNCYFLNSQISLDKAKFKSDSDLDGSLNDLRKALEELLKSAVFEAQENSDSTPGLDGLQIEQLLPKLKALYQIPKPIFVQIESLQRQTTLGSHGQGSVGYDEFLSPEIIKGHISQFEKIRDYFLKAAQDNS